MLSETGARANINHRVALTSQPRRPRTSRRLADSSMASMNRRDLVRSLTTAIALPAISGLEPDTLFAVGRRAHRRARTGGLQVLNPHQGETVATIAEMIVPATDTPGARAAQVHRCID